MEKTQLLSTTVRVQHQYTLWIAKDDNDAAMLAMPSATGPCMGLTVSIVFLWRIRMMDLFVRHNSDIPEFLWFTDSCQQYAMYICSVRDAQLFRLPNGMSVV